MGKQIELYLADNKIDGVVKIDVINWSGAALKVPRSELNTALLTNAPQTGVYFLCCVDEDTGEDAVYIGETGQMKQRLQQHVADYARGQEKFYWHTAIIFTGTHLTKDRIQYMENALRHQATKCNNYKVLTKATHAAEPNNVGTLDSCNQFMAEIKVLLGLLNCRIYDEDNRTGVNDDSTLYCGDSKGAKAYGYMSANGFTVLKGSTVSATVVKSFETHNYYALRRKLEQNGTIKDGEFQKDYDEFKSPSAASSVVLGRSSNGQIDWKSANGTTLKDILVAQND